MNLSTQDFGFGLPHPFMAGASPLTATLDGALQLEDAGAPALVLPSLFEEQLQGRFAASEGSPWAGRLTRAQYLEHLSVLRTRVGVPVFASLNGTTASEWLRAARDVERAGAQAIELNFYNIAVDPNEDGASIERRLIDTVAVIKESVRIPVAVKLTPFFTSVPAVAQRLDEIGADGLVLFNAFQQADIDPELRAFGPGAHLSGSDDLLLRLHAVAILARRLRGSIALSGGVHTPIDAVKAILAGADVVQMTSAVLRHGAAHLARIRRRAARWMADHGYSSLAQLRGAARLDEALGAAGQRRDYIQALRQWDRPA